MTRTIAMKRMVLVSGCWNIAAGFAVISVVLIVPPQWREALGVCSPGIFWTLILAGVLWVTGIILALASRNLATRAPIVYYEGLARLAAAALLIGFGVGELGTPAWVIGISDLGFGLMQVFLLPPALGRTHGQMLRDRPTAPATAK